MPCAPAWGGIFPYTVKLLLRFSTTSAAFLHPQHSAIWCQKSLLRQVKDLTLRDSEQHVTTGLTLPPTRAVNLPQSARGATCRCWSEAVGAPSGARAETAGSAKETKRFTSLRLLNDWDGELGFELEKQRSSKLRETGAATQTRGWFQVVSYWVQVVNSM